MATAISERLKNQAAETAGLSRVYNRRGRVLSGYGGSLGGYTMSLQKTNADKEDQIMQNKYENGEIGIDEMISYLNKTSNRAWLSNEDKKLLTQTIDQMNNKKTDADYLDKYNSGTITAKQYLAYKQQRLSSLNPGSSLYDQISTDVEQLKKNAGKEDLNSYFKREAARISNLSDQTAQYSGYENLYREMSNKANGYGLTDEANDYLTKAGDYKIQADQAKETLQTANVKQEKSNLVDKINLAINSYVNNEISPQDFAGVLDQFQSTAISGGHTDLLKDLNSWGNDVREDIQYGKSWDRGGTRIKGPGVGTGGGSTYDIYGNLISGGEGGGEYTGGGTGGGVSYTGTGGGASTGGGTTTTGGIKLPNAELTPEQLGQEKTPQTAEEEDKMFKDNYELFMSQAQNGEITGTDFMKNLAGLLDERNVDLNKRLESLSSLSPSARIKYNGVYQKASAIIADINKELNDDWTISLGIDAPDVKKAGTADLVNSLKNTSGNLAVVLTDNLVNGLNVAGSQQTPLVVQKLPGMDKDYVADENGIYHEINSTPSSEFLDATAYYALPEDKRKNYTTNSSGGYSKKTDKYIDIKDTKTGEFLRYWLDDNNKVKSVQRNGNDTIDKIYNEAGIQGLVSPSSLNKQIENLRIQNETKLAEEQQTLSEKKVKEQQTLDEKKAAEPRQFGLASKEPLIPKLNVTSELPVSQNKGGLNITGPSELKTQTLITPKVVQPTFASTQTKLDLTPSQNASAGPLIQKAISSVPQTITSPTSNKPIAPAPTKLQLATPTPISTTKLNIPSNTLQTMAPNIPNKTIKKPSLWNKITSLFKR